MTDTDTVTEKQQTMVDTHTEEAMETSIVTRESEPMVTTETAVLSESVTKHKDSHKLDKTEEVDKKSQQIKKTHPFFGKFVTFHINYFNVNNYE